MANVYKPEGIMLDGSLVPGIFALKEAMEQKKILEARVKLCDSAHNLILDLDSCRGIIPRSEAAIGIDDGTTRDIAIISRVNKPVCFTVTDQNRLKRRSACHTFTQESAGRMPSAVHRQAKAGRRDRCARDAPRIVRVFCGHRLRDFIADSD